MLAIIITIYAIWSIFPFFFVLYATWKICRHYNDGLDITPEPVIWKQVLKRILTVLLSIIYAGLLYVGDVEGDDRDLDAGIVRYIYYWITIVAWAFSFILVRFMFQRRLRMSWFGQRSYWPISFIINMLTTWFEGYVILSDNSDSTATYKLVKVSLFLWSVVITFLLGIIAIKSPNDFTPLSREEFLLTKKFLISDQLSRERRKTQIIPYVKVSIKDFSARGSASTIYYHLSVRVDNLQNSVKRTIHEFDALHKALLNYIDESLLPPFPRFSPGVNIDDRMELLQDYIKRVNKNDLMFIEFLDFLDIQGEKRILLITEQERLSSDINSPFLEPPKDDARNESIDIGYYVPVINAEVDEFRLSTTSTKSNILQMYISSQIAQWHEKETYVEYELNFTYYDKLYTIYKRYQDFHQNQKLLTKAIAPGKPPKLPGRQSITHLIKGTTDPGFLTKRKQDLESYLSALWNDPAYHCSNVFSFLGLESIDLNKLWKDNGDITYSFVPPLKWEGALDDSDNHFIIYSFAIEKFIDGKLAHKWTAKRRFKEFYELQEELAAREGSPSLDSFFQFQSTPKNYVLPPQSRKTVTPLHTHDEIQQRRNGLESILSQLVQIPFIHQAYVFRKFIMEPSI